MNVNGASNNNSIWQAILNALDANRTEDNKAALDSVREQIRPFFEETPDTDVALSVDDTAQARVGNNQIHVTQAIAEMFNNSLPEGHMDRINLNDYDFSVSEDGKTYTFNIKQSNDAFIVRGNNYVMTLNDDGTYTVKVSRNDCGSAPYDKTFSNDGRLIKEHWNSSASLGPEGQDYTAVYNADGSKIETRVYNSPDRNSNVKTEVKTTNKDGSYSITTKDIDDKVIESKKFDKDGNEIKDTTGEIPKVAEGEKGSKEYFSKLWDLFADFNSTFHAYEYDEQGRVISGGNQDRSSLSVCNTDVDFNISYGENGEINIDAKWLGSKYKQINISTDGTITVTSIDRFNGDDVYSIEKYNKDGEKIEDLPVVESGKQGSASWVSQTLLLGNDKTGNYDITYDSQGRVVKMDWVGTERFGIRTVNADISINYNNDGSCEVTKEGGLNLGTGVAKIVTLYDVNGNIIETKKYDKNGKEIKDTTGETPAGTKETKPSTPSVPHGGGSSGGGSSSGGHSGSSIGGSAIGGRWSSGSVWQRNLRNIFSNIFSNTTTTFYNRMSGFLKDIFRR